MLQFLGVDSEHARKTSIYQNIHIKELDTIDLTLISRAGKLFAENLIQTLLEKGALEMTFEVPFTVSKKWWNIIVQAQNDNKLKGQNNLAIGFPLVHLPTAPTYTLAPLFIWQVHIEKQGNAAETWKIKHNADAPLLLNPSISKWLPDNHVSLLQIELHTALKIKKIEFHQIITLWETLGVSAKTNWVTLENLKNTSYSALWNAGVIGIFPPILEPKEYSEWLNHSADVSSSQHTQGLSILHPDQSTAFANIHKYPINVVEGVSGSGKTYLLTHLLGNALSNEKKCLVVSDYIAPLKQVQRSLEKYGLDQLQFLLKNTNQDLRSLMELVRAVASNPKPVKYEAEAFQLLLKRCERAKEKLDTYYKLVEQPLLGKQTWTELVGNFLQNNRIADKAYLDSHLSERDFEFSPEEYQQLLQILSTSKNLYPQELGLKHPLKRLHKEIFTIQSQQEGLLFAQQTIDKLLQKAYQLLQRYSIKISNYKAKLRNYFEQHYEQLNNKSLYVLEQLADAQLRYGDDFEKTTMLSLYGTFSKRHKEITEEQVRILKEVEILKKYFEQYQFFNFVFYDVNNIQRIKAEVQRFRDSLQQWGNELPYQIQEEIKRLSENTVLVDLDFQEQIQELEYAEELLIEEMNESNLLRKNVEKKILSIPKRQKHIENLIDQLESIKFHLKDFELCYEWERHWLSCKDNERSLVRALIKARPPSWEAAFKSWYLYYFLSKNFNQNLVLPSDDAIVNYALDHQVLRPLLLRQIEASWTNKRDTYFKELKKQHKETYQNLTNKKWDVEETNEDLHLSCHKHFESIAVVTPILFATTTTIYDILFNSPTPSAIQFDYLIIEAAHTSTLQQWMPLFQVAKKIVLFSNPTLGDSTYEGFSATNIDKQFIHRVILSNYYGKSLGIMPFHATIYQAKPITTRYATPIINSQFVRGKYHENEQTNEVEAKAVLQTLFQIESPNERTYPSVGIACFSYPQRNLILEYLEDYKQGKEKFKLDILERCGLIVLHVEELKAQQFDVLIISGTFGPLDVTGQLPKSLSIFETQEGNLWVNQILSCAQNQVFLLYSLPQVTIQNWVDFPSNKGSFFWGSFLAYAQAIEQQDETKQLEILEYLTKTSIPFQSIFLDEVKEGLKAYFESDRLLQNERLSKTIYLKLGVSTYKKDSFAMLQYEGKQFPNQPTDYCWEHDYQLQLAEEDVIALPVWSIKWWKNPREEARRLASTIIKLLR